MNSETQDVTFTHRALRRATSFVSPQPNVECGGSLGRRFWLLVPAIGVAAGLSAGLLMHFLALVQWLAFDEHGRTFLEAVQATGCWCSPLAVRSW